MYIGFHRPGGLLAALGLLFLRCIDDAAAIGPVPVQNSGLAGINGFTFYDPFCAHACYRSFSPFPLSCTSTIEAGGHTTADELAHDIALCRASNFPFLSSIAWCVHLYCPQDAVPASLVEKFWETEITGDVSVVPQWSYGEVMSNISRPPTRVLIAEIGNGAELNETSLTTMAVFNVTENTLVYFFRETALESIYGLATCLPIFAVPVLLTCLAYLPFMTSTLERIKIYLYPSLIGAWHDRPLPYLLGNVPTIGQSLFIAIIVVLNIIFISVGYKTLYPNLPMQWYQDHYQELMFYVCLRTGVMAFCLMPTMLLFSSRNNILLWLSNWSHSTYLLLHRWIARIFLIQALLHSILALVLWVKTDQYAQTVSQPFWIWGCVATVAAVIIVLSSALVVRRRAYEAFLAAHIVLAVICIVGCWYHIEFEYDFTFGYETWLYAAIAVWFFDRAIRVLRILKFGIRYGRVSQVSSGVVRIDLPGIRGVTSPARRVHVYFPALRPLAPWQNHPFSTIPTAMLAEGTEADVSTVDGSTSSPKIRVHGSEKGISSRQGPLCTSTGLTLFVRKTKGMTSRLQENSRLLTFLEGPYPNNDVRGVLRSDRLLLIGGGIGITGLLSFLGHHESIKVFQSVKASDQSLIDALSGALGQFKEKEIAVGRRLDIESLLREEVSVGWPKIGVVVCGPASMCDDTRAIVARLAKEKAGVCAFELEVDSFSW